jgi:uncharacterized protein YidB (DUF937 family)
MAYKTDPGMQLVTAYLPAADADALVKIANKLGLSRAELLRHMARELIENYTHNGENR